MAAMSGCKTATPRQPSVEQPPTVVMPPTPAPTTVVDVAPPSAAPDFRQAPPVVTYEPAAGITYTVKKGDSLSLIAARYGVSAREIAELNGIANPNKIRIGQKLVLPAYAKERAVRKPASKTTSKSATAKKPAASQPVVAGDGEYVVKPGDSLWKIAHTLQIRTADLRAVNNLQSDKLQIGQKLKLPASASSGAAIPDAAVPPPVAPAVENPLPVPAVDPAIPAVEPVSPVAQAPVLDAETFEITVAAGESIESIATKYGVLTSDITRLNNITEVAPGQKIKLPLPTP